jgi:hypothetical protein
LKVSIVPKKTTLNTAGNGHFVYVEARTTAVFSSKREEA